MSNAIKIAFIGLGNMGAPMAANLLKADLRVSVYDVQAAPVAALAKLGARAASSSIDAVRDADVVISMLPTGAHVRALYLGSDADSEPRKQGIFAHLRADFHANFDSLNAILADANAVNRGHVHGLFITF